MTATTIRFFRRPRDSYQTLTLGYAVFKDDCGGKGWIFIPHVFGRNPSRKYHPTWEACLPRWIGYPNYCESEGVKAVRS